MSKVLYVWLRGCDTRVGNNMLNITVVTVSIMSGPSCFIIYKTAQTSERITISRDPAMDTCWSKGEIICAYNL